MSHQSPTVARRNALTITSRAANSSALMIAVAIAFATQTASAALPVFGGPGGPFVPTGTVSPVTAIRAPVNNAGVAIALADSRLNGVADGQHGFRWDTSGAAPQEFSSMTLHPYPSAIQAINNLGVAVGSATTAAAHDQHAIRYAANSIVATELDALSPSNGGHAEAYAYGINQAGTAVGQASLYQGNLMLGDRAVRWDAGGTAITQLGVLATSPSGESETSALAINNAGTIIGRSTQTNAQGADLGSRAVRWAPKAITPFELDPIFTRASDGYTLTFATALNTSGTTVGLVTKWAGSNNLGFRPARWAAGGTAGAALDVLGTDVNGASVASGVSYPAINDAGVIAGTVMKYASDGSTLGNRAVRWNAGGTAVTELGLLPGQDSTAVADSGASRINGLGTIVGYVEASINVRHATIWLPNSTAALDLNTLLSAKTNWVLSSCDGVSDTGFVVGRGRVTPANGVSYTQSFLMLVPQAGTYGRGDANLDTNVGFADLVILAQHYGQSNAALALNVGDLNLDGTTNFADLVTLAQNYNTGLASVSALGNASLTADWALAQSLVPEPAMLVAGLGGATLLGRRRR